MNHGLVIVVAVLALAGCAWLWAAGVSAGRKTAARIREIGRTGSVLVWGLVCAGAIVALQWVVLTRSHDTGVIVAVLGIPGLLSGLSMARLCEVTLNAGTVRHRRR